MAYDDKDEKDDTELSADLLEGVADETDEDEDEDEALPPTGEAEGDEKWE